MVQHIHRPIDVLMRCDKDGKETLPVKFKWAGRTYTVDKVGYYHRRKLGRAVLHVFDVLAGTLALRLAMHSESLMWTVEQISDGT